MSKSCVVCLSKFRGKAWKIPCLMCGGVAHRACIATIPQEVIAARMKAKETVEFFCPDCASQRAADIASSPARVAVEILEPNELFSYLSINSPPLPPPPTPPRTPDDRPLPSPPSFLTMDCNSPANLQTQSTPIRSSLPYCPSPADPYQLSFEDQHYSRFSFSGDPSITSLNDFDEEDPLERSHQPPTPTGPKWEIELLASKRNQPLLTDGMGYK
jgi:hypothetical protein